MAVLQLFFWLSLAVLFYTYAGYAILLYLYNNVRKFVAPSRPIANGFTPDVTLIIPAYNEAELLDEKIRNCLALKYPPENLNIFIVTDGSADSSREIIRKYHQITLLHVDERRGKMAAINRAMQQVKTPIVIFSDANTVLNEDAVSLIVQHYNHDHIGGVSGEKKVVTSVPDILIGEGIYWQYESKLKQLDSDFNTVVGAAGELFSMRTSLFKPQKEDTILDDFILSLNICMRGYKVIYEPLAFATETPSINIREESKRRIRIAAGAFQSLARLPQLFNVFKFPLLAFQYISRRVFRWALCPLALIIVYASNFWLLSTANNSFYAWFFIIQNLAYALAITGWLAKRTRDYLVIFVPFYFVFMNVSLVIGFSRFISGNQTAVWEKSKRASR